MMLHASMVFSSKSGSKTAFETPGVSVQLTFQTTHTHTHTHAHMLGLAILALDISNLPVVSQRPESRNPSTLGSTCSCA